MEHFEQLVINMYRVKPKVWLRYVDDIFSVMKRNQVENFLAHMNSLHPKMRFTVEYEVDGVIAFLDTQIRRKTDGTLSHTVYRKPTHTDKYLNGKSHHHPSQLTSVVASLVNRAVNICDEENINQKLHYIDQILKNNDYSKKQRSWRPKAKKDDVSKDESNKKRAFLPYCSSVSDKIKRVLKKYDIDSIFRPPAKIKQLLRSPKDHIPWSRPGVYEVPCSCGKSYIGETKRSLSIRLNEHIKAIMKNQVTKSAICEHLAYALPEEHHEILFHKAKLLSTEQFYIPRLVRESIEIKTHKNFNRDQSFRLSPSWDAVINRLKQPWNKN